MYRCVCRWWSDRNTNIGSNTNTGLKRSEDVYLVHRSHRTVCFVKPNDEVEMGALSAPPTVLKNLEAKPGDVVGLSYCLGITGAEGVVVEVIGGPNQPPPSVSISPTCFSHVDPIFRR
mgnify:CR=1 FL=1